MKLSPRSWLSAALLALACAAPAQATPAGGDSSSDAPSGFGTVISQTKGVVLRVPINSQGQENRSAAEMRFYQGADQPTKTSDPGAVWSQAVNPGQTPEVLGTNAPGKVDPRSDSSTWGWYNWGGCCCDGGYGGYGGYGDYDYVWATPYYYSYYYPTFYFNSYWYYFSFAWYWEFQSYRFYYYPWWY